MRVATLVVLGVLAACGGKSKDAKTTPAAGGGSGAATDGSDPQAMTNTGEPTMPAGGVATTALGPADGGGGGGMAPDPGPSPADPPPIVFPNQDPDPRLAKAQVDQQLAVAKQALSLTTPDADAALRAAREALKIDASSVDAAAYVAFAYYHKKQYDTAELVLDDLFKRPSAKQNPTVFYVYGLVYDHTVRPDQAVLAYRKAVELHPSFASAHVNLGVHQLRNKQYGEAQQTFERLTQQLGRNDEVTMTSLGSAYRGRSGDYPAGSGDRNQLIMSAEAAYKRALAANPNYGPAHYNLGLLYLDADPFPSGGGALDTLQRLTAAQAFLDNYKNSPGVDIKLYDERMKDVDKAVKREQKRRKKAAKGG